MLTKMDRNKVDEYMKQESLNVFERAKTESDPPPCLDDYKEVSSSNESISTTTSLEIKAEPEETDAKLALAAVLEKEQTSDIHGFIANEKSPELDLYDQRTLPENTGFDYTSLNKTTDSQRQGIRFNTLTTTNTHKSMPPFTPESVNYMFDELDRYCEPCDAIFTTRYSYRSHIRKPHSTPVILSSSCKSTSRRIPDIDDPHGHCNVCQCRFRTRSIYRTHLHSIHQIGVSRECEVAPTFKCFICKRRYKSKRSRDDHVDTKHCDTVIMIE